MDIREFGPLDRDVLLGWIGVRDAVRQVDSPWSFPLTEHEVRGMLTHGWDGEPGTPYLATVDGTPVAAGSVSASDYDNLTAAWLSVEVHPEHRRRGHGQELLAFLEQRCLERGRTTLGASSWEQTGGEAFGLERGYVRKQVGVNRRQYLADLDRSVIDRLHQQAAAAASGYELERAPATTPDADLDAMARLVSAINDAPNDDLELEDEVFTAARVRAYENAQAARGHALLRLIVRHTATREPAGQTVIAVDTERPHLAEQHDTSVVAAHRGHRLGALLKTGMLQWLAEDQPQVQEIDTWNAESNGFMIGVNEALGYRVMGREMNLQKRLAAPSTT